MGVAVAGASWYLTRLARGPHSEFSITFLCARSPNTDRCALCSHLDQGESHAMERRQAGGQREDDVRQPEVREEVRSVTRCIEK